MDQALAKAALESGAGGVLRIDLGALKANYLKLRQLAAPTPVSAVVKADAYGLGVEAITQTLYAAGCRHFFVALTREAFELRPQLPADAALYVLNGLAPGSETRAAEAGLIPVLNSPEQLDAWAATARSSGEALPALLQVDTGMSRLGFMSDDLKALAAAPERLNGLRIDYLMSHLACADEPAHPANGDQLEAFELASRLFPDTPLCFANSGGLFLGAEYHADLCRPGIALYGGAPHVERPNPMQPVIALDLAVVQTRTVPAGTRIGYGGTVVTDAPKRLATLSAGYADGLPRRLGDHDSGSGGAVFFNGVRLPFIGRVSMDSIIVDIDALPEDTLKTGDFVELIGPHQSLDELAAAAGTIAYEILTQLGPRYHRYLIPAEA